MSEQNKILIPQTVEEAWNRRNFAFPGELITKQQSRIPGA
jgi:hypothetical protein